MTLHVGTFGRPQGPEPVSEGREFENSGILYSRLPVGSALFLKFYVMRLLIIYLKTHGMKNVNWKSIALYVIKILELVITGAAGGAAAGMI